MWPPSVASLRDGRGRWTPPSCKSDNTETLYRDNKSGCILVLGSIDSTHAHSRSLQQQAHGHHPKPRHTSAPTQTPPGTLGGSATRSRRPMRCQRQLLLPLLQLLLLGVGATAAAAAPAAPTRPRVEYTEGEAALGIDDAPRFGWTLPVATVRGEEQLAYQLTVTHAGTNAVVWDSQRVVSNTTQFVALPAGTALEPDTSYLWAVRWWSSSSAGSASSAKPSPWLHSSFSTGIGSNSTELAGWKGAQWIVPTKVRGEGQGNQIRKHFSMPPGGKAVTRAALYIGAENVGMFSVFLHSS